MPNFKKDRSKFKMKGWSGYQKSPLKTDAELVQGARDAVNKKALSKLAASKGISDSISEVGDTAKSMFTKGMAKEKGFTDMQDKPVPQTPKKPSNQYEEGTQREKDLMDELEGINNDIEKIKADKTMDPKRKEQLLKKLEGASRDIDNQMWQYD